MKVFSSMLRLSIMFRFMSVVIKRIMKCILNWLEVCSVVWMI